MPKLPRQIPIKTLQKKRHGYTKKHISMNAEFYNSSEWRALRKYFFKQNPLCKWCEEEGQIVEGKIVDHIVEINDGGAKLDTNNLMTLCARHHAQKTNFERKKRKKKR